MSATETRGLAESCTQTSSDLPSISCKMRKMIKFGKAKWISIIKDSHNNESIQQEGSNIREFYYSGA